MAEGTEGAEHVPLDAWPLADMPPLPLFLTPFMQQTCKWASLCQAPHPTLGVQGRVRLAHFLRPRSSQSAIYNSPLLQAFQPTDWALLISFFIGVLPLLKNFNAHLGEASAGVFFFREDDTHQHLAFLSNSNTRLLNKLTRLVRST